MKDWIGMHRHDLAVGSPEWARFGGAVHNGVSRLRRLVATHSNLQYNGIYVYPYAVTVDNQIAPFETVGNLVPSFEGLRVLSDQPFYPTGNRKGLWVDWCNSDWGEWLEHLREVDLSINHGFWFVDNIPDWHQTLVRMSREHEFAEQVHALCKFLRNINDVPVVGNVYNGGSWLTEFLKSADGAFFENSYWMWYNGRSPRPEADRNRFLERVAYCHKHKKMVIVGVPYLAPSQVPLLQELYTRLRDTNTLYAEYRNPERAAVIPSRVAPSTVAPASGSGISGEAKSP